MRDRRIAYLALVAATWFAAATTRVEAHAAYERSTPGAGDVVVSAPARLDVWFTQELFRRAQANTLVVLDGSGRAVHEGEAEVDQGDRHHLSVGLRPGLAAGTFTVRWTSLSAIDGDTAEGTFTFTVDPSAKPTAPPPAAAGTVAPAFEAAAGPAGIAPAAVAGDDGAAFLIWPVVAGAAILAAGAIGAWAILATRSEHS